MERNRIRWDVSRETLTVRSAVVGGQARRRVVEAQEEAEEAHGFERQNRKREIDVCVFVSILLALHGDDGGDDRCDWHAAYRRLAWRLLLL
jgi:hypothetical protein